MRFRSLKVLHGVCQLEKYYSNQQLFISLALKLLCKTPNEAVVESLGSLLQKHMKPERSAKQNTFDSELHIDWNRPVISRADSQLERSLDRKFGSRKRWNFKAGESKFFTSKVVNPISHGPLDSMGVMGGGAVIVTRNPIFYFL